ncbi:hypothetical protein WN55_04804 [Dufourea novaeangliae]|uniref:Uncharacterized protein n=1 Tax=Dufourea novaeangliae TaxID=178035 RepID=A0A154PNA8_DUFNO|nr:hypothetical protein WN55_04804 [Dufourea novaeangliae]
MGRKRYADESDTSEEDSSSERWKMRYKRLKKLIKKNDSHNGTPTLSDGNPESHRSRFRYELENPMPQVQPSAHNSTAGESNDEVEEVSLSKELLDAIGKRTYEKRVFAPTLHSEFAIRWGDRRKSKNGTAIPPGTEIRSIQAGQCEEGTPQKSPGNAIDQRSSADGS